ncbi:MULTISPECIES: hypothetical protein [unclassified Streptomyces]|uniref:hypothetical protein n=1 Tax=unclassified Streptomyces TaxID=2593676 RepID=UPI002DDBF3FF|nr:hypothetical protein [Streptomyces sp. NBC_01763]WSC40772.1 hypothetical protein OHA08_37655 [Streptomyces sp. NBC_01763]
MRMKIIVAVGVAGLLATGCTDGSSGSDKDAKSAPAATVLPQKLTKPNTEPETEPQPSPADDAPFDENLAYELRLKTLKMAQATGRTTAECPKGLESKSGTRASCTTTYEGLKVVWDVTIGKKAGWSDNVVEFDAVPDKGILTSDGVARLLYGNYRDSIDHARCNDIPKAVLVPLNVKTKYSCEVVFKGRTPGGLAEPVRATDAGPRVH